MWAFICYTSSLRTLHRSCLNPTLAALSTSLPISCIATRLKAVKCSLNWHTDITQCAHLLLMNTSRIRLSTVGPAGSVPTTVSHPFNFLANGLTALLCDAPLPHLQAVHYLPPSAETPFKLCAVAEVKVAGTQLLWPAIAWGRHLVSLLCLGHADLAAADQVRCCCCCCCRCCNIAGSRFGLWIPASGSSC